MSSWDEYYRFPVAYRHWLVKRIEKEISKAHEAGSDIPSRAKHQNTPDARAWAGRTRAEVPSKLTRFT